MPFVPVFERPHWASLSGRQYFIRAWAQKRAETHWQQDWKRVLYGERLLTQSSLPNDLHRLVLTYARAPLPFLEDVRTWRDVNFSRFPISTLNHRESVNDYIVLCTMSWPVYDRNQDGIAWLPGKVWRLEPKWWKRLADETPYDFVRHKLSIECLYGPSLCSCHLSAYNQLHMREPAVPMLHTC